MVVDLPHYQASSQSSHGADNHHYTELSVYTAPDTVNSHISHQRILPHPPKYTEDSTTGQYYDYVNDHSINAGTQQSQNEYELTEVNILSCSLWCVHNLILMPLAL